MNNQKENDESADSQEEMKNDLDQNTEATSHESDFESAPVNPKHITITDVELRDLKREISEYKDKYLRLLADAENARKRMQKEKQELTRYAMESFIVQILPPLDNLDNALGFAQEMSDEVRNWAFGFQMILAQFKDVLTQNGVTAIESVGHPFNPHLHEAIEMVESTSHTPGMVIEECVKGYKMGDKTIRPSRVKVAKGADSTMTKEENKEQE